MDTVYPNAERHIVDQLFRSQSDPNYGDGDKQVELRFE